MIFETLWDSAKRGELLLIDGGFCHWHLRRDGQLTIREIISLRSGAGKEMLAQLRAIRGACCLYAVCPADLAANDWYLMRAFSREPARVSRRGRALNGWRLVLDGERCPHRR